LETETLNSSSGVRFLTPLSAGPEAGVAALERSVRMAPYRDALYAFVTFRPEGLIEIEGRRSGWVSPSPRERGYPNAESLTPFIADRELRTTVSPQSP
jgi:hypothetical protein